MNHILLLDAISRIKTKDKQSLNILVYNYIDNKQITVVIIILIESTPPIFAFSAFFSVFF